MCRTVRIGTPAPSEQACLACIFRATKIARLFRPRVLQIGTGCDQPSLALCRDGLHQGAGGIADFLLKGIIAVERVVACRIRPVATAQSIDLALSHAPGWGSW